MCRPSYGLRLLWEALLLSLCSRAASSWICWPLSILSVCSSPLIIVEAVKLRPQLHSTYRNGAPLRHHAFVFGAGSLPGGPPHIAMRKHYVVSGMKHVVPCRVGLGTGAISSRITALGLFDGLSGWFSQAFGNRWYVPPMPTGEFSSTLLRKKGELQSEKDTQEFFETIGVKRDASLFEISRAYEHALDTLPEDMRGILQHAFHEFLRKEFVNAFEHMETFIKRGPAAWEEYWDPSKDAFGNPVTTVLSPEEEDKIMEKRMPPELDVTKFRDFWRKRSSRFGTIMSKVDMASRLRLTCNFGGRLVRCATTMVPVMLLGFFPQFSSTSLALQGLLASGFIFKGDRAVILEREKKNRENIPSASPPPRSPSSRTLLTSAVLCIHSLMGIGIAKLMERYTSVLEYLTPQILKVASIHFQFIVAALMWDTSNLTASGHIKLEKKRLSKMDYTLTGPKDQGWQ